LLVLNGMQSYTNYTLLTPSRNFRQSIVREWRDGKGIHYLYLLFISPMWQESVPWLLPHNCLPFPLASPLLVCHSHCIISLCLRHFVACRRLRCLANSIMQRLREFSEFGDCPRVSVSVSVSAVESWNAHNYYTPVCTHLCAFSHAFSYLILTPFPLYLLARRH